MLKFKAELNKIIAEVMDEYERQEFIEIAYPSAITEELWSFHEESIVLPKVKGSLYFIFDNNKDLLYIGKTKEIGLALLNHLKHKTSTKSMSILSEVKKIICAAEDKRMFIKVIDLRPVELASTLKPYLIKEYEPSLCQRLS